MDVQILAQVRNQTGKNAMRKLRREDMIPAVFYGPKSEPISLAVPTSRLQKLFREMGEEHKLLDLVIEDGGQRKEKKVMIREVQTHPVRRRLLHIDFLEVAMDQAIVVEVPVELIGKPEGVESGGVLNQVRRTLSVRCLPGDIPEKIEVDVSALNIGESIHVADLVRSLPFELADDESFTVVTIGAPEAVAEVAEGEEGEEVEEQA